MFAFRSLVAVGLVACLASALPAAAPPASLTPAQRKLIDQRNRWMTQANALSREGKVEAAIAALHKGLALDQAIYGGGGPGSVEWLEFLARLQERGEHFAAAITTRQEVRALVTSLWSVSDPATSVLMEQFYQRLWGAEKVSKLEALRQAQLYVLNNPKAVLARAAELRKQAGAGVTLGGVGKEVVLPAGAKPADGRSHPAWWAAFVFSGDPGEERVAASPHGA